jgi:hypothetical protein
VACSAATLARCASAARYCSSSSLATATSAASGSLRPSCFAAACIASSTASTLPPVSSISAIAFRSASVPPPPCAADRSLHCRSWSFFVLPACGSGSVCWAPPAASAARGGAACAAGSSVLNPMSAGVHHGGVGGSHSPKPGEKNQKGMPQAAA